MDDFSSLHDTYVVGPANKALNSIVFAYEHRYLQCPTKELGINSTTGNPIHSLTPFTKDEILQFTNLSFLFCNNMQRNGRKTSVTEL